MSGSGGPPGCCAIALLAVVGEQASNDLALAALQRVSFATQSASSLFFEDGRGRVRTPSLLS